ncbi:hypothetical protein RIF29_37706 [Crotalaria pallida]|uniref:Uncharacterized protein n=1 Tax=Crotalaria pallida TaxID=3830 RepID=A0AAN9ECV2_CROPI
MMKNKVDDGGDPFGFIIDHCHISASQELLLRHQPFVGEKLQVQLHQPPPPSSSSIFMLSVSQTQHQHQHQHPPPPDVFLTPLDKSLPLPTSADDPCTTNRVIDLDDDVPQFVDLARDSSDLGFPDDRGIKRVVAGHDFKGESHHHELQMKRLKLSHSHPKPGSDSSKVSLGIQSQKNNEGYGKCKEKLGSASKSPFSNVEQLSQSGIPMQNNKIPSSSSVVFDVLKALSEKCGGGDDDDQGEEEDGVERLSLLEAFKKSGLTFPRPRWWPENDINFKNSRIV